MDNFIVLYINYFESYTNNNFQLVKYKIFYTTI